MCLTVSKVPFNRVGYVMKNVFCVDGCLVLRNVYNTNQKVAHSINSGIWYSSVYNHVENLREIRHCASCEYHRIYDGFHGYIDKQSAIAGATDIIMTVQVVGSCWTGYFGENEAFSCLRYRVVAIEGRNLKLSNQSLYASTSDGLVKVWEGGKLCV